MSYERTGGGYAVPSPQRGSTRATHPALLRLFDPKRGVAYARDGNRTMQTPHSLAARQALRRHPAVVEVIARMMRMYARDASGCVQYDSYLRVNMAVAMLLVPT